MPERIHQMLNQIENEQNVIDHDLEVDEWEEPDLPTKIGYLVLEMLDIYMGEKEGY